MVIIHKLLCSCTISYTELLPEQLNYCASTQTNESTKQNTFTHMQIQSVEDNKNGEVSFGVENSHEGFDAIPVLSHEGVYTKDLEHNNGMQEANCDLRITSTPYKRVRSSNSDLVTPVVLTGRTINVLTKSKIKIAKSERA